jgi:septum formation protein
VPKPLIYLASRSPRRQALLEQIRLPFAMLDLAIDETPRPGEPARDFVARLARDKAEAGRRLAPDGLPVLAADTDVVLDGEILGKPADEASARLLLERLSGRSHQVLSGVALAWDGRLAWRLNENRVWFRRLSPREIQAYWWTGEPADKAGGYAIQGQAALFIERIEGSYSGVMGLPLFETAQLLAEAGIRLPAEPLTE